MESLRWITWSDIFCGISERLFWIKTILHRLKHSNNPVFNKIWGSVCFPLLRYSTFCVLEYLLEAAALIHNTFAKPSCYVWLFLLALTPSLGLIFNFLWTCFCMLCSLSSLLICNPLWNMLALTPNIILDWYVYVVVCVWDLFLVGFCI